MRTIPLTHGHVALVDDADYAWLSRWSWRASPVDYRQPYAVRWMRVDGKKVTIYIHREILGLGPVADDPRLGDHINRERLDNRRRNLRITDAGDDGSGWR